MNQNQGGMLHLRGCLKRLQLEARRPSSLLKPCRWLGGIYPDSPTALREPMVFREEKTTSLTEDRNCQGTDGILEDQIRRAEIIWDYMLLNNTLEKSDLLLVLGSNDKRVASHAAKLWLNGYADWLLFSGELGNLTKGKWTRPEAEVFRDVALNLGVPDHKIILEKRATNTGENIRYSHDVLKNRGIRVRRVILVQMPFMERRSYATFMRQWPGDVSQVQVYVTSPPIALRDYPNEEVGSLQEIISILLGCLQRIKIYPEKGFQIPQDIPKEVWEAYALLVAENKFNRFIINGK